MEHLVFTEPSMWRLFFLERLMGALSSVRIEANPDLFETGLVGAEGHHSLKRVLTYGTFDLLHYGHIRLLQQASKLGDYLIVGLSTDEFNALKGKTSFYSYEVRREMLEALRYVDLVIPENDWNQKTRDVEIYHADIVCMGGDWAGDPRFESLKDICDVVYLNRTPGISTTEVKSRLAQ
jgi:glycerol-3-phosphate cytidylyltransferase